VIAAFDRTGGDLDAGFLVTELRAQVAAGAVAPVFFGSAITGVGVPELLDGVEAWLPPAGEASDGAVAGTVFKVARRPSGEKIVYARLEAGRLAVRDRVAIRRRGATVRSRRPRGG
jgi:ribosomal protection tetracycline resistance protein